MATVTMDIAELDKLRQELKEQKDKQETLNKELMDVKSDKRVIVKLKSATKADFTYRFDSHKYNQWVRLRHDFYNSMKGCSEQDVLKECITIYPIRDLKEEFKEFINFEDAKEELKAQLEEKYKDELADLRASKKYADDRLRDRQKEFEEAQRVLILEHKEIESLKQTEIDTLQKKYEELESGKKELSKIEELQKIVQELERELVKEKAKSWFQKLIGR